jgi:hypothetical protein
MCVPAGICDPA